MKLKILGKQENLTPSVSNRIQEIANLPGVEEVVALPDVHLKKPNASLGRKGYIPSSLAVLSRNILYPQLAAFSVNCGMSLLKTDLQYDHNMNDVLKRIVYRFNRGIVKGLLAYVKRPLVDQYALSHDEFQSVCLQGPAVLTDKLGLASLVGEHVLDISSTVDERTFDFCNDDWKRGHQYLRRNIGRYLHGNHFIEFQVVDSIYDSKQAAQYNVSEGQIFVLFHMGMGGLSSLFTDAVLQQIIFTDRFIGLTPDDPYHHVVRNGVKLLMNYGLACRFTTAAILRDAITTIQPHKTAQLFWDSAHDFIEDRVVHGDALFTYRNQATKVYENKPVIISGTQRCPSYVGFGRAEAAQLLASADHGYGVTAKLFSSQPILKPNQYQQHAVTHIGLKKEANAPLFRSVKHEVIHDNPAAEYVLKTLEEHAIMRRGFRLTPIVNLRYL